MRRLEFFVGNRPRVSLDVDATAVMRGHLYFTPWARAKCIIGPAIPNVRRGASKVIEHELSQSAGRTFSVSVSVGGGGASALG